MCHLLYIKPIPIFRHVTFKSYKGLGLRAVPGVGLARPGLGQIDKAGDYKSFQIVNVYYY